MINTLHIRNIGIIDDISIDLDEGFNVLTGETGAGKTLIIDSLNLACGSRFSKEIIRKGEDYCLVELSIFLPNHEDSIDGNIIVSREIHTNGRSSCKINGRLVTVNELKDQMKLAFKDKYKIDIVHGKMASGAKDLIMEQFKNNEVQILISTTVVEVGVDVPNATTMVIFDADRFGLSTLHQLRGRVGRGISKSQCILISDSDAERLKIMEREDDGFVISEEDFKLRGHGDLFGTKQSGDMTFKIASIKNDYKILLQAKKDSKEYLENKDTDNSDLKNLLINSITKVN